MQENEMGGACGTYRGKDKCTEDFGGGIRKEATWNT
jgi:hypothetical protein